MEGSWPELPYTVLTQIIGLLETSDVVNFAKVCENWRRVAIMSLKSVKIDESLPFGGSWINSNHCNLEENSLSPFSKPIIAYVVQSVADIATSLAEITDQIEHLYFNGSFIPASAFEVLFSSQKAIKTLHVKKGSFETRLLTNFDSSKLNFDIPRGTKDVEVIETVMRGITQHEASLEDINLWIEGDELQRTKTNSSYNFGPPVNWGRQVEDESQSNSSSELEEESQSKTSSEPEEESYRNSSLQPEDESQCNSTAKLENKSLLHISPQPEEKSQCDSTILPTASLSKEAVPLLGDRKNYFSNLKSVSLMTTVMGREEYVHPTHNPDSLSEETSIENFIYEDVFHENQLKRFDLFEGHTRGGIDVDNGNIGCISDDVLPLSNRIKEGKFSNLRVLNFLVFDLKDEDLIIEYCPHITHIYCRVGRHDYDNDDGCPLKIIRHFGPQLLGLRCPIGEQTAKHIEQYCCNLESLGLLSDSSFSCLSQMKKLKILKVNIFKDPTVLENHLGSLIELEILNYEYEIDAKVFDVIRRGAQSLQYLRIEFGPGTFADFVSQMERFIEFLEEFHCLEKLRVMLRSDYWYDYGGDDEEENSWKGHDKITELLLKNQSKLKRLHLSLKRFVSKENKMTLIEQMPRCKITFHDYDYFYG